MIKKHYIICAIVWGVHEQTQEEAYLSEDLAWTNDPKEALKFETETEAEKRLTGIEAIPKDFGISGCFKINPFYIVPS